MERTFRAQSVLSNRIKAYENAIYSEHDGQSTRIVFESSKKIFLIFSLTLNEKLSLKITIFIVI